MIASAPSVDVWDILNRNLFFVKNAVKRLEAKSADKYDIYDPNLRELLVECREPGLGAVTKLRRLAGGQYDAGAPFNLAATIPGSNQQLCRVRRQIPFFSLGRPGVEIYDYRDVQLVTLKARMISWGCKFRIVTPQKAVLFEFQVKPGFNRHRLLINNREVGEIARKWRGQQSDYFADGFDFALSFANDLPPNDSNRLFLIAFAIGAHRILN